MEHLQEAIERARQKREGAIGRTTPLHDRDVNALPRASEQDSEKAAPVRPVVPGSHQAKRVRGSTPHPSKVRYSTTRRVEPDPGTLSRNRVIAGDMNDPRVEDYRQLRSQVLDNMKRNGLTSLAITGANESAGKTLTAINLAISISQEVNQTVLLVDLDLRAPSIHTTLGIEVELGVIDHLLHGQPLEKILVNPGYSRLVVLPGLPQEHQISEVLSSPEMKLLLSDIVGRYPDRIIIFDLPPLLRNDDAMVFAPNADACLLVFEAGVTTPDEIKRSMQLLKHSRILGTVLNKAR